MFAAAGLSDAQISTLFVLWTATSLVCEVPFGLLADALPRRLLLGLAPLVTGLGFALWTLWPGYPAFAAGFVLWGAGGALRSGTAQALVHDELTRLGAADDYAAVIGRSEAASSAAALASAAVAGPVLAVGGYGALGWLSVAGAAVAGALGASLPDAGSAPAGPAERDARDEADGAAVGPSIRALARAARALVGLSPGTRLLVLAVAGVTGLLSVDEYLPLRSRSLGVAPSVVPVFDGAMTVAMMIGAALAGRGSGRSAGLGPVLGVGAVVLALGAATPRVAGLLAIAAALGVFQWAAVRADAALQRSIPGPGRATITSLAGLLTDLVALPLYAAGGLASAGGRGPAAVFLLVAALYALLAVAITLRGRPARPPAPETDP